MLQVFVSRAALVAGLLLAAVTAAAAPPEDRTASGAGPAAKPLPRVLIIGDSISKGYTPGVVKRLGGRAEVTRIPGNGMWTGTGLEKIDQWLGDGRWDVIHFNWGLWDMYGWEFHAEDRSPEAYEKRLEALVTRLEKTGATLIWATTTPACPGPETSMRKRWQTDVVIPADVEQRYLETAARVMLRHGVRVNDLHALVKPHLAELAIAADNVHYTAAGSERLADQVAARIAAALEPAAARARPNVLLIMADDCTFSDLPLYGGTNVATPHIDALARGGLTFDRGFASMAICVPCRAELFTGQYPFTNGCFRNHTPCRPGTRSLPQHLAPLGYRVGIAGKVHVEPAESFPFEAVPGFDPECTRNPTQPHDLAGVREFLARQAGDDERFCLVVGLVEPHVPWVMGDAGRFPPERLALPPNLVDTPRTRADFGRYLAEIESMDGQVGELLDLLAATGHADDTLVLFTSEQGAQFPGSKWTCYDAGLHTALVARWPGRVPTGARTAALVQYADVAPTLVELAGGDPAAGAYAFDGRSFAAVLGGRTDAHRDYAYGLHNNHHEGPDYAIRAVTDGRWRYIRNLTHEQPFRLRYITGLGKMPPTAYWPEWAEAARTDPRARRLVDRYTQRPAEELYDTAADPAELKNLADDPAAREVKSRLSAALDRWLEASAPAPSGS
jgi:uncharacterized sulfatase